jgi:hypothetical protein
MNRRTPKALQVLASTVAPLFLALYAAGQSAGISDFWSLIRIGDQAVGYFRETARPSVDGRTVTAIDSVVGLNRLGDKVEIIQKFECCWQRIMRSCATGWPRSSIIKRT